MKTTNFATLTFSLLLTACASSEVQSTGTKPKSPAPPVVAPLIQEAAAPGSANTSGAPESAVAIPEEAPSAEYSGKVKAPKAQPKATDMVWKMKKATMTGPGQVSPKNIGQFKDPKTGAVTDTRCWNYKTFAITESRTKGEVGAGEIILRHSSSAPKENLCASEFAGKSDSWNTIEGYFAGVGGDYAIVEGADVGEGLPQFQIFSVVTGKEVLKGTHDPDEEFSLTQRGQRTSLTFFSKVAVKCELLEEGLDCWKKVIGALPVVKPTPMPDCQAAFKVKKASPQDTPLVALRAEVSDLAAPNVKIVGGGHATCHPGPQ